MKRIVSVNAFIIVIVLQVALVAAFSNATPECKQHVILWMLAPPIALFLSSKKLE